MSSPRIHRALFGDVGGAHNTIAASAGTPSDVLKDLAAQYTDRLLPAELKWEPYSCGFSVRANYVLTRTFAVSASRAGMVLTHALIVPLDECVHVADINDLLALLPTTPIQSLPSEPPVYEPSGSPPPVLANCTNLARVLLAGGVPVWLGHKDFEHAVRHLWLKLWPEARRDFRFRSSAHPDELSDFSATIVCTLPELRLNWRQEQFANLPVQHRVPTAAEGYILGLPEGEALGVARKNIEYSPPSIAGLKRLEQYLTMRAANTTDSLRAAARLLNTMVPSPSLALGEKDRLLDELAARTSAGSVSEVLGLRNLTLPSFAGAAGALQLAISAWFQKRSPSDSGVEVVREIALQEHPWREFAVPALRHALSKWRSESGALLWAWWLSDPRLIHAAQEFIPQVGSVEVDLVFHCPLTLDPELGSSVLTVARERQWFLLHARVLGALQSLSTRDKLQSQLALETSDRSGLALLAMRVPPNELVAVAVDLKDHALVESAARAVANDSTLLAKLDPSNSVWRQIWIENVEAGGDPFAGIEQPMDALFKLLDVVLQGTPVPSSVLGALIDDSRTNLALYGQRRQLWTNLPSHLVPRCLGATGTMWLRELEENLDFDRSDIEEPLVAAILTSWRRRREQVRVSVSLELFGRFGLHEDEFRDWLATAPEASQQEASAIGRMLRARRWVMASEAVSKRFRNGRWDLQSAVVEVGELLSIWERLKLKLVSSASTVREDDWWNAWMELSAALYPSGVKQGNVWERAGGELNRTKEGTGSEQWNYAIGLLRKGGAGRHMTIAGLLHEMRKDFSANSDLLALESIYLKLFVGQQ